MFVLVEELHPRHLEVKFKFARRDPDCLQESLVVLCEHLASIVPHGWVLVAHRVLVTIREIAKRGAADFDQQPIEQAQCAFDWLLGWNDLGCELSQNRWLPRWLARGPG